MSVLVLSAFALGEPNVAKGEATGHPPWPHGWDLYWICPTTMAAMVIYWDTNGIYIYIIYIYRYHDIP